MANRIKGITVEIGGDTTGLDKALMGVNSSITKTQSALNDVNRLLKLDPSNTVLVTQKQKLLSQAVSQTSNKLSALESAQEQVAAAFACGDIGQDEYQAFQREIEETYGKLNKYKSNLPSPEAEQDSLGADTAGKAVCRHRHRSGCLCGYGECSDKGQRLQTFIVPIFNPSGIFRFRPSRLLLHNVISTFSFGNKLIFNGLGWTTADTGHAMCAISFPHRFSVYHVNIVQWTTFGTFSTRYTDIGHPEPFIFNIEAIIEDMEKTT